MRLPFRVGWLAIPLALSSSAAAERQFDNLKDGEHVEVVRENCLYCHDDSYIVSLYLGREEWEEVLDVMVGMGMPPLEGEVRDAVLDYLAAAQGVREPEAGGGSEAEAGEEAAELVELPWAEPLYPPNPLSWHRPRR